MDLVEALCTSGDPLENEEQSHCHQHEHKAKAEAQSTCGDIANVDAAATRLKTPLRLATALCDVARVQHRHPREELAPGACDAGAGMTSRPEAHRRKGGKPAKTIHATYCWTQDVDVLAIGLVH